MTNEYTIQAVRDEQERLQDVAELNNIRRLQKRVDAANLDLQAAQLRRQNRIMSEESKEPSEVIGKRATIDDSGYPVTVSVDGVIVGQSTLKSAQALADELNASDRKCDLLKKIMEEQEQ